MASRWDLLFDQKPVPILEHLCEEVSKLLAKELAKWPLAVQDLDLDVGGAVAPWVLGEVPRPGDRVFREAFRLARWDLAHEVDAYDDYMRNQRWSAVGLTAEDKPALLFISRWLLEQLTSLREATEGRVKRRELLDILERTERRAFLVL
jgi:hypothetical protein